MRLNGGSAKLDSPAQSTADRRRSAGAEDILPAGSPTIGDGSADVDGRWEAGESSPKMLGLLSSITFGCNTIT